MLGRSVFLECGVRFLWERGDGEDEVRVVATARMRTVATARMRARARMRMGARVLVKDVVRVYTQTLPVEKVGPDTQPTVLRGEGKTFSRAVEEGLWTDVG